MDGSGDPTGAGAGARRSFGSMVTMRKLLAPLVGGKRMSAASHCTYLRGGETQGREEVC